MSLQTEFDFDAAMSVKPARVARSIGGHLGQLSGEAAEVAVSRAYQQRGLRQVARRWRGGSGEIDIIFRDGAQLVFVEVKKSRSFARAAERLGSAQMHRIFDAASEFLAGEPKGQLCETRFDVALVDGIGRIEIIENAFGHF